MKNFLSLKKAKIFVISAMFVLLGVCCASTNFAAEKTEPVQTNEQTQIVVKEHSVGQGLGYMAAAIAIAVGSIGSGIAVASSAPAALGAFSENPSTFGKTIVFVALGEGVSILSFIASMMIILAL